MGSVLRIVMILVGILILFMIVFSLAKRKMTQFFCLVWSAISILMIIAGILLKPCLLDSFLSRRAFVLLILVGLTILWTFWFITLQVSTLSRRNQELAIQVSLLNQEYIEMSKQLDDIENAKEL